MWFRKFTFSKVMALLLVSVLISGQLYTGSFAADTNEIYKDLMIEIDKKVENVITTDPDKFYLGQLVKATYTITSNEIEINVPKEIVFVIDLTTSMSARAGAESRIEALKKVLVPFLNLWRDPSTKVGLVCFAANVILEKDLKEGTDKNIDDLQSTVGEWSTSTLKNNTNLGDGIRRAYYILKDSKNTNARKYIISLTDGMSNTYTKDSSGNYYYGDKVVGTQNISTVTDYSNTAVTDYFNGEEIKVSKGTYYAKEVMAKIAPDKSIKNFFIGFGIGANEAINLNYIGQAGGVTPVPDVNGDGKPDYFYRPTTSSELQDVFNSIAQSIGNEILLTTANIVETTNDVVSLPTDIDPFKDIPKGTPQSPEVLKGTIKEIPTLDENNNEMGSEITIPLNLKLIRTHDNYFAVEKIVFSVYYRVASTGSVTFPQPKGEFAFTDPINGDPVTKQSTGNTEQIVVKQTVDSVYIPPKIMFTGQKENTTRTANVNPAAKLDNEDKKIESSSWTVKSGSNVINGIVKNGDTSAQLKLSGNVGIAEISGTSSGFAFGGKDHVVGTGNVMVIKPTIKHVDVELGKTNFTELNLDIPEGQETLLSQIGQVMKTHTIKQSFNGYWYKIYPCNTNGQFHLGVKNPVDADRSSIIQDTSFADVIGNWSITPIDKDGKRYYQIMNRQSQKFLTAFASSSTVFQYSLFDPFSNDYQLWKIDEMEDGSYKITSKQNGKSLQIVKRKLLNGLWTDVSGTAGSEVVTGTYNGYNYQKWHISEVDSLGLPAQQYSLLNSIQIDKNSDGTPSAFISSPEVNLKKAVKISFNQKEELQDDGSTKLIDDYTKLMIYGVNATIVNKGNPSKERRYSNPVQITATVKYINIDGTESKADIVFTVDIFTVIDVN